MAINESNIVTEAGYDYETVAVSQTDQALGTTGATGDRLQRLVISVSTSASSTVSIKDGTTSIPIMAATTAIGVYTVELGIYSATGAWSVTTGAGATVIAVGTFT